jgi:hypothetical protein
MTQNSSWNCPELPGLDPSTLWLITILCNVLLIFLRIKEPRNEPESPRNVNIDTFFWIVLGFFWGEMSSHFDYTIIEQMSPDNQGHSGSFWVILGVILGIFICSACVHCFFATCWQWWSFSHTVIIFSQLKGIIRRAIKFMTCMLIVVSWNGKCALL